MTRNFALLSTLLVVAVAMALANSGAVQAYFEFDTDMWGTPAKEVLADGRIRMSVAEKVRAPIPDAVRARIEAGRAPLAYDPATMHVSHKMDIVMKPDWKFFDLEDHSDADRALCHDKGDQNMRLSLFGASAELRAALLANPSKVVLTAKASKHTCHGQPIFRKVDAWHTFAASSSSGDSKKDDDELLLVTSKARYDQIWDEADVSLSLHHPYLTHIDSKTGEMGVPPIFDHPLKADHGVGYYEQPITAGAARVKRANDLMYPKWNVNSDPVEEKKARDAYAAFEASGGKPQNSNSNVNSDAIRSSSSSRNADAQFSISGAIKSIKKVGSDAVNTVKNTASSINPSQVASAVGQGLSSVGNALKSLTSINTDFQHSIYTSVSTCAVLKLPCSKNIVGMTFSTDLVFTFTISFRITISNNKLTYFSLALTGKVEFTAGAKTMSYNDGAGDSVIVEIPGPKITFVIGPVPVWIDIKLPILAGVSVTYGTKNNIIQAGITASASATVGVAWSPDKGTQMLTSKEFNFQKTLDLPSMSPFDVTVSPFAGFQVKFSLYSMASGYPQVLVGLDNRILAPKVTKSCSITGYKSVPIFGFNLKIPVTTCTDNVACKFSLDTDLFIKLSVGLSFELVIATFTIFSYSFGPWTIWTNSWPLFDICSDLGFVDAIKAALGIKQTQQQFLALPDARTASTMSSALPLSLIVRTAFLPRDSGRSLGTAIKSAVSLFAHNYGFGTIFNSREAMALDTNMTGSCGPELSYGISFKGYYSTDSALFFVTITRNYTDANPSAQLPFTLTTQRFLAYLPVPATIGLNATAAVVEATQDYADAMGIDLDTLKSMTAYISTNINYTAPTIEYVNITIPADSIDNIRFDIPTMCPAQVKNVNRTDTLPPKPARGTPLSGVMDSLGTDLLASFISLITDVLVTILLIALIEFVVAWQMPRIIGEKLWPTQCQKPRAREYLYGFAAIIWGLGCFVCFCIGGSLAYAQIIGARVDPNYKAPPSGSPQSSYLVASGVQVSLYEFAGAQVTQMTCPQYYPCSPNCRDLCTKATNDWPHTSWPFCPLNANISDTNGCEMFAWDAALDAALCLIFLIVGVGLPLFAYSNVYRRMMMANAAMILSAMFMTLLWRRVDSFMVEVMRSLFEPANGMVVPYTLYINETSEKLFKAANAMFYIAVGVNGLLTFIECYTYYKACADGKITFATFSLHKEMIEHDDAAVHGGDERLAATTTGASTHELEGITSSAAKTQQHAGNEPVNNNSWLPGNWNDYNGGASSDDVTGTKSAGSYKLEL